MIRFLKNYNFVWTEADFEDTYNDHFLCCRTAYIPVCLACQKPLTLVGWPLHSRMTMMLSSYSAFFWPLWRLRTKHPIPIWTAARTPWSISAGGNPQGANGGPSKLLPPLWKKGAPLRGASPFGFADTWVVTKMKQRGRCMKEVIKTSVCWCPDSPPEPMHCRIKKKGPTGWVISDGGAHVHPNGMAALGSCGKKPLRRNQPRSSKTLSSWKMCKEKWTDHHYRSLCMLLPVFI